MKQTLTAVQLNSTWKFCHGALVTQTRFESEHFEGWYGTSEPWGNL